MIPGTYVLNKYAPSLSSLIPLRNTPAQHRAPWNLTHTKSSVRAWFFVLIYSNLWEYLEAEKHFVSEDRRKQNFHYYFLLVPVYFHAPACPKELDCQPPTKISIVGTLSCPSLWAPALRDRGPGDSSSILIPCPSHHVSGVRDAAACSSLFV